MKTLKKIIFQLFIFLICFAILELLSIKLFPEYSQNQKYKRYKTTKDNELLIIQKGKYQFFELFKGLKIRSDKDNLKKKYDENNTKIWIFGDSVTGGYGLKYTDTFFYSLEKILNINEKKFNIFPVTRNAGTFEDIVVAVKEHENIFNENDYIVSQFNYNDIQPLQDIKKVSEPSNFKKSYLNILSSSINKIRFEYLHQSTFIRVVTHYASIVKKKTSGNCEERGRDALGHYSYSYGSLKYLEESKFAWDSFENELLKLKDITASKKLKLIVLISPVSLQLKNHEKINFHNLDLDCSRINARQKMLELLNNHDVNFSDPLGLFNDVMNTDIEENNFEPFFFEYDTIHPNIKGSLLLAISLYKSILNYK